MSNQETFNDVTVKVKDLEDENELLLQLHQVQEELEGYFLKCKELESNGSKFINKSYSDATWVDDGLPEALAEVERLKTLISVQAEIKEIESNNALNVKLGNILLEGSNSIGGISRIPFVLLGFWRNATRKKIAAELGGKEFTGVIKAYEEKGFDGVNSILKNYGMSPILIANAYTILARHLMKHDATAAAIAASKAFETDPKPYRLKWLACRVHEAGNPQKADALLTFLPEGIAYSDSEAKQISQIRHEAKHQRQKDAQQKTQIVSKQQQVKKQLNELKEQINALTAEKGQLEEARDAQAQLAGERLNQINELSTQVDTLSKDKQNALTLKDEMVKKEAYYQQQKQLMKEEMLRAEAQIEIIKEIFLRGPVVFDE